MLVRTIGPGVLRCALAFLVVFGFAPAAKAAFTVTINGITLQDGGSGDQDARDGYIEWQTTINGYEIELTSSTDRSRPTADLTTSELRIVNVSGTGTLNVSISERFNIPNFRGEQTMLNTLTRNLVAGLSTSGTVSSTTTGASEGGGGAGTTDVVTLTDPVDSGISFGSFDRTSEFYLLTQAIDISGLRVGDGVTITASSFSPSGGNLEVIPAPPALVLLASGVGFLGLYRLGTYRRRLQA